MVAWGSSVIGPLHKRLDLPNQDSFHICNEQNFNLIAVCDGMGSCKSSHIGSRQACLAVEYACRLYVTQSCEVQFENLLQLIHKKWLSSIAPFPVQDCHTTCLFAWPFKNYVWLAQLGDGLIGVLNKEQVTFPFIAAAKDFVNITQGLTLNFFLEHWHFIKLPKSEVDMVFLATDGVSDDLSPQGSIDLIKDLAYLTNTLPVPECQEKLSNLLENWPCKGHIDDKTVAVMFFNKDKPHAD